MEGQPKGLVDIFTTLPVVEKVRLEVLDDREQGAAGRVSRDAAVGAGDPANEGTCEVIVRPCGGGEGIWPED